MDMMERDEENLDRVDVVVRGLRPGDLDQVVRIDAKLTGRTRSEYFKVKLAQNLQETGIKVSLAAESKGDFVGFLLARVFYGEFGLLEPTAILDTIGVHPDFSNQGIGRALLRQLNVHLAGLHVTHVQTQVEWRNIELLKFFQKAGYEPAPRFCLSLEIKPGSP